MNKGLKYRLRIVSDRPIPQSSDGKGPANTKYNLHSMEVNDSFFAAEKDAAKARAAVYMYGKRHGKKFDSRNLKDGWVLISRVE